MLSATPAGAIPHVPTVLRRRDRLALALVTAVGGAVVDGPLLAKVEAACAEGLPGRVDPAAVRESVLYLLGEPLTQARAKDLAHRLAGNVAALAAGRPVPPWVAQRRPEWVPAQVTAADRTGERRHGLATVTFTLKVLAGTPAGLPMRVRWSFRTCRYLARPLFGFSRPPTKNARTAPPFPYVAPEELVTLRLLALVAPAWSRDGPGFNEVAPHPGLMTWNRAQLKYRARLDDDHACPDGRPRSLPCYACPRGYLTCRAGTHAADWAVAACPVCNRPDALHDPARPGACVGCHNAAARSRKES